jgi:CRP-like cAMP-binding protein
MHNAVAQDTNNLLASLSAQDWQRWRPELQVVQFAAGQVLFEAGDPLRHNYFPTTAIVSLLHTLEDGGCTELAMTGREGMVGISAFMGSNSAPCRCVVQQAGWAYRVRADFVQAALETSPEVMHVVFRFMQALFTQMSQVAVCNRHHGIEQQLARWLLLNFDRLDTDTLPITQEKMANLLGVRREGITRAAGSLQDGGAIRYRRGHMHLLSREGLRAHACECYEVVSTGYSLLQAEPQPPPALAYSRASDCIA